MPESKITVKKSNKDREGCVFCAGVGLLVLIGGGAALAILLLVCRWVYQFITS